MRQAVVIGGSIAGILAARVLADHFEHVTVVERDRCPDGPSRGGGRRTTGTCTLCWPEAWGSWTACFPASMLSWPRRAG